MSDLIITGVLLLHQTPRLSIVAVGDFEHRHKLHHPEVFGPLSDDACQALCLLQIDLEKMTKTVILQHRHIQHIFKIYLFFFSH